ncbi:hypothetical protein BBJ28_00005909 [Nothophytophthora sp. Chile5]|nr:hypothetical protein BBJ28_00005909 [Nothophytophthora sp. Chile5]
MYSREKLERLLRHAKVTTQSIQTVSNWMLSYRENLAEMVALWLELMREGGAEHQIVYLYIANDAMQVGVRKYGRQIAAAFEDRLVEAVELVMGDGEEKVKRCAIKIVGIWKERGVLTPPLLAMLQNICAGKPAVEPVAETENGGANAQDAKAKLLREMTSDVAVERVLEDLSEVPESSATTQLATRLQDLVNATISADMLSDRMFQLESSLSAFHHACSAHDGCESARVENEDGIDAMVFPSRGGIAWDMMDQQVYDLDIDRNQDHVQQYRSNLEDQAGKRELVMQQLRLLEDMDLFAATVGTTTVEEAKDQERALERLYDVAVEAESRELQQLEEQRAEFRARRTSNTPSTSGSSYSSYQQERVDPYRPSSTPSRGRSDSGSTHSSYSSRRPNDYDYQQRSPPPLRRHNSASAATERGFIDDRYGQVDHRRDGQEDRYAGSPSYSKRPKLQHAHSMESQNVQWQEASRPILSSPSGGAYRDPYAAVEQEQASYSPHGGGMSRYSPNERSHQRQRPAQPNRRSRWDSMPEDHYGARYEDRRW